MIFEVYFLTRFISKMNDNSSGEKLSHFYFHSVNVKGNWTHLVEKKNHVMLFEVSF